jgi:hypothetical protein
MAHHFFAIGKDNRYNLGAGAAAPVHHRGAGRSTATVEVPTKKGPKEVKVTSVLHRPPWFQQQVERQQRKQKNLFGRIADKLRSLMNRPE